MVSIQPKPKKGLEVAASKPVEKLVSTSFNPAEAEEGFRSGHGSLHEIK